MQRFRARRSRSCIAAICAIAVLASTSGCNLFGGMDSPEEARDRYLSAIAKANDGDCIGAKDELLKIVAPNDDVNVALGWAYLCIAGATAANVASSIFNFTSSSTDLTVIGILGRTLLPMTADKLAMIDAASDTFQLLGDLKKRSLEVAISKFVKASAILANQATNTAASGSLDRTDISAAACVNDAANCAASASCTAGMTDGDVTSFFNAITAASTALAVAGAGDLAALANALAAGFGLAIPSRCFIFNKTVPQ